MSDKIIIAFIVSLAFFMEAVDTTILNTAIPAMSLSFSVNPINLKIALISYLVSLSIFIPVSGWVADKFGIKKVFMLALIVFILSSTWCGFSKGLTELVIGRILQGLGGAFLLPLGRLILVRTFERHEFIIATSRAVMVMALGMMLGPVLGGFITHYLSWHWVFWVNIPVGLLTLIMAQHWLKPSAPEKVPPLDKLGFILFGIGLAGLTFGLSAFSETNVSIWFAISIIIAAIISLTLYVLHSRRLAHPIVKTKLFVSRSFRISAIGNLFARFGFGGIPFLLPLLFQIGLGYSAQLSGLLLAPTALGVVFVKPFALPLLRALGYKRLLIMNTILVAMGLWALMIINSTTPLYVIASLTFLFGFLISLQYSGMSSLGYADVTAHDLSSATSIMSTIQQLAQSFGVAMGAILVRLFTQSGMAEIDLTTGVFHKAFFMMGILTLFSVLIFIQLKTGDGDQMIGKKTSAPVQMS